MSRREGSRKTRQIVKKPSVFARLPPHEEKHVRTVIENNKHKFFMLNALTLDKIITGGWDDIGKHFHPNNRLRFLDIVRARFTMVKMSWRVAIFIFHSEDEGLEMIDLNVHNVTSTEVNDVIEEKREELWQEADPATRLSSGYFISPSLEFDIEDNLTQILGMFKTARVWDIDYVLKTIKKRLQEQGKCTDEVDGKIRQYETSLKRLV